MLYVELGFVPDRWLFAVAEKVDEIKGYIFSRVPSMVTNQGAEAQELS